MPTVTMTLDALAASGAVDVAACFRTASDAAQIERNGIVHRFEPSDRALVRGGPRVCDPMWCTCTVSGSSRCWPACAVRSTGTPPSSSSTTANRPARGATARSTGWCANASPATCSRAPTTGRPSRSATPGDRTAGATSSTCWRPPAPCRPRTSDDARRLNDVAARREPRGPVGRPPHRRQGPARRGRRRRRRGGDPAGRPSAHAGDRLVDGRSHHRPRRQRGRGRSRPHPSTGAGAADARWYRAADVLLSTSRHEGSNYSLIEAMTHGCPPAVTDIPPHRSITGRSRPTVRVRRRPSRGRGHRPRRQLERSTVEAYRDAHLTWPVVARRLVEIYRAVALGARRGEQSK